MYLNTETTGFPILIEAFWIDTVGKFVGAFIGVFIFAICTELLARYPFNETKYIHALRSGVRTYLSALLMLIMMTFNLYLILAIAMSTFSAALVLPKSKETTPTCH